MIDLPDTKIVMQPKHHSYLKDDPAKESIATSYSAPRVLAEAAHKPAERKPILRFSTSVGRNTNGSKLYCASS